MQFDGGLYRYNTDNTPLVHSVAPMEVSSAITTLITIAGSGFSGAETVQVGGRDCLVNSTSIEDELISCILVRNSDVNKTELRKLDHNTPERKVDISVFVPNKGFAGDGSKLREKPAIQRGFEVSEVQPKIGSIIGGSEIQIFGFGFLAKQPSRHTVSLINVNKPELTDYNKLVLALGLTNEENYGEVISCNVTYVDFNSLRCDIPMLSVPLNSSSFFVSVELNKMVTSCKDESNCLYSVSSESTPYVYDARVTEVDATTGVVQFDVTGNDMLLQEGLVCITLGQHMGLLDEEHPDEAHHLDGGVDHDHSGGLHDQHDPVLGFHHNVNATVLCSISTISNGTIHANSPPMPAGNWMVTAHVNGIGCAVSSAEIMLYFAIHELNPVVSAGSLGGGTLVHLRGYGFGSECHDNNITLTLNSSVPLLNSTVSVSSFTHCHGDHVDFLMPDITHLFESYPSDVVVTVTKFSMSSIYDNNGTYVEHPFAFEYSSTATPLVSVGGTAATVADDEVQLDIIAYGSTVLVNSTVVVGGEECTDLTTARNPARSQELTFTCGAPHLQGELSYPIVANVYHFGVALLSNGLTPQFDSVFSTPVLMFEKNASIGGGTVITVSGTGLSVNTVTTVCGKVCELAAVSYDMLMCVAPFHVTRSAIVHWENLYPQSSRDYVETLMEGVVDGVITIGSSTNQVYRDRLNDGDFETYYSHGSNDCFVGVELPDGYVARPFRARYFPRLQKSGNLKSYEYQGSSDGGVTWDVLALIPKAHEGWNFADPVAEKKNNWYNRFRIVSTVSNAFYCQFAELRFLGVMVGEEDSCSIEVVSSDASTSAVYNVGSVSYDAYSHTPYVSEISPNNGTALGGTVVVIQGQNFVGFMSDEEMAAHGHEVALSDDSPPGQGGSGRGKKQTDDYVAPSTDDTHTLHDDIVVMENAVNLPDLNHTDPIVYLNGIECMVESFTNTSITCIAGARTNFDYIAPLSVSVYIHGFGYAIRDERAEFLYVDKWSALTSWRDQEPPVADDLVWIPKGQVILLDVNTPVLFMLVVEGQLFFDKTKDLTM